MSKEFNTPKKFYRGGSSQSSCCRLCLKICDVTHCKNIFHRRNSNILSVTEELLGDNLPRDEQLPHLLCRPCERRLVSFKAFKQLILQSQHSVTAQSTRVKRCTEVSPSILPTSKTRRNQQATTSRRAIAFSSSEKEVS